MEQMYIWAAIELADGGKIVLLIFQERKKLPRGFFENGPVRLAGIPPIQFQVKVLLGKGILICKLKCCLFNTL